jgi:death-on-curing protein
MPIAWLDKQLVIAMHERQLAEHGGSSGIRDEAALEAALARPRELFDQADPPPDLAALAAALAFGLLRNPPFIDGRKRTAHVSYRVFLALNGAALIASDENKFTAMLALAEGKLTERRFSAWLRERIAPASVHEPRKRRKAMPSSATKARGPRTRSVR